MFHLGGETLGAIAADGLADFGEGGAGGLFYFGDLLGGACGVAFDEAAGEFGFEDDDGESVAEDVVEIAGDAFAFGDARRVARSLRWRCGVCCRARFCWAKKKLPPPMRKTRKIAMTTFGHAM